MQVVIRSFNPVTDTGIIYDTYPKGVYYGFCQPIHTPKHQWFAEFFKQMQDQLKNSSVLIAVGKDNPNVIFGYAIITGKALEFVYVKEEFRKQGIARLLLKNHPIEEYKNVTRIGRAILNQEGNKHGTERSSQENDWERNPR